MNPPQDKTADALGIASIAKSVTTLAKAVSDMQKQMKDFHQRLAEQEGNDTKKKKSEFIRAYKSVLSIMKALKVMPEMKEFTNRSCGETNGNEHPARTPDRNAQLLRKMALTLSDIETVASYVSKDDECELSTAEASTLSRPADFVKIDSNAEDVKTENISYGEIDALKHILTEKDEQMRKLMEETKELIQKKNSRWWAQTNFLPLLLLLGGAYIGNNYDYHQNHFFLNNYHSAMDNDKIPVSKMTTVVDAAQNMLLKDIPGENPPQVIEDANLSNTGSDRTVLHEDLGRTNWSEDYSVIVGKNTDSEQNRYPFSDGNQAESKNENVNYGVQNEETENGSENIQAGCPGSTKSTSWKTTVDEMTIREKTSEGSVPRDDAENGTTASVVKRGWLEQGLCDELSDMISCRKKDTNGENALESLDNKSIQKMIIRRQIITAISVAAAMTLPKLAPHMIKINVKQVLSLSFWRSIMEFVTVMVQ